MRYKTDSTSSRTTVVPEAFTTHLPLHLKVRSRSDVRYLPHACITSTTTVKLYVVFYVVVMCFLLFVAVSFVLYRCFGESTFLSVVYQVWLAEKRNRRTQKHWSQSSLLKKNLNVSRPSEHPTQGENVKTLRWDDRLRRQNIFIAFPENT